MQQRQIMIASPASLWRLRVAYLILKSSHAVCEAFHDRIQPLMPVAGRRYAFSMVMASCDVQIHFLNILVATWIAQQPYGRLFKEAELSS
jgi:hypothetical protein